MGNRGLGSESSPSAEPPAVFLRVSEGVTQTAWTGPRGEGNLAEGILAVGCRLQEDPGPSRAAEVGQVCAPVVWLGRCPPRGPRNPALIHREQPLASALWGVVCEQPGPGPQRALREPPLAEWGGPSSERLGGLHASWQRLSEGFDCEPGVGTFAYLK